MSKTRTRLETQYRETISKDGRYSTHIPAEYSQLLIEYCRKHNVPKLDFVCESIAYYLDFLKRGENCRSFNIKNELSNRLFHYCEIIDRSPSDVMDEILTRFFERDDVKAKELELSAQKMMSKMPEATKEKIIYDHCMKMIKTQGLVEELEARK